MLSPAKLKIPYAVLEYIFDIGTIILVSFLMACGEETLNDREGEKKMSSKTIEEVLREHTDEWMSIAGVVGTAIGEFKGEPCIKIYVVKKNHELKKKIPTSEEGYRILIEETGEFKALGKD